MRNKITKRPLQHYYDAAVKGIITMDEFYEISMILPTKCLYTRNSQIENLHYTKEEEQEFKSKSIEEIWKMKL